MRKILPPLLLALCLPAAALAQEHNHAEQDDQPLYEGVWNVKLANGGSARFELHDWVGTWRETGARSGLPASCRGRKLPVTVQHSTEEGVEFTVFGSSVNRACPDTGFAFRKVDDRTLEAALADGATATMKRAGR
jgi:hypothetical protein